jgi:hypothetical protein
MAATIATPIAATTGTFAFHVVVADLDHALGPERHEREILAGVLARPFVSPWRAVAGYVGGPVPRMIVESGDEGRRKMDELREHFGLKPEDLNIDLGPLGPVLPTDPS